MLARGTKILSPHIRATHRNGTIHAVLRSDEAPAKSLCGKTRLTADSPPRRFQQGLGNECVLCTTRVIEARVRAIKDRKALRSAKNQPEVVSEAIVAPVKVRNVNARRKVVVVKSTKATRTVKPKATAAAAKSA